MDLSASAAKSAHKSRWWQFSLRRMIIWVTILGLALSWLGNEMLRARRQRQIVETIQRLGGRVRYDYDPAEIRGTRQHQRSRGRWLTELVGPDLFAHMSGVYLGENTSATDEDLEFLSELPQLQAVELFGQGITDKTIDRLKSTRGLRGLHLDDTLCTTAAVSRLAAASSLEYFTLLGLTANDANMAPLEAMENLRSLNYCSFSRSKGMLRTVTDAGLAHIAKLEKLEALYLDGANITDEGLAHLRGLKHLSGLAMDSPNVSDAGMLHLAGLTSLTFLNFHKLKVGDGGVEHLAGLRELDFLCLDDSKITDVATATIAKFPKLRTLHIARTAVTDEGLRNLQSAASLQRVSVASSVTKDGLATLSKALPQCNIRGSDGTTEYNFP
jgi:hypothetical protein